MKSWEYNARNLTASLSFYGPVERRGGVDLITSRVAYSVFNIALLADPVSDQPGELDRRIQLAAAHYALQNRPWSFWVCEDFLPRRVSRRLMECFDSHGLQCIADSPGMEAQTLAPPRHTLPPLEYRRVEDGSTRSDFTRIVSTCFHIPLPIAQIVYEYEPAWTGPLRVWLGYHQGEPVSSAALVDFAGVVGIYSVATLPHLRGHGIAEATMRHALAEALPAGEPRTLVLRSSPAGLDLYRRLGFRRTSRFFVFATA